MLVIQEIYIVNDKTFGFTYTIGKKFLVLLNKNKSRFHTLKLVGKNLWFTEFMKTAKAFSLKSFQHHLRYVIVFIT